MYVTHLECSLTAERYPAGRPHNLSAAGKPLLVRYDHERARMSLTRESLANRPAGMWKWRELLPLPEGVEPVSLGEPETRSEEHTSELQSQSNLVCRLLLEKKKHINTNEE